MRTHQRLQWSPETQQPTPPFHRHRHAISPDLTFTDSFERNIPLPVAQAGTWALRQNPILQMQQLYGNQSSTRALRQSAVLQMQQLYGNAAVRRMLSEDPMRLQRQPGGTGKSRKKFQCLESTPKLEKCLNDEDRLGPPGWSRDSGHDPHDVQIIQQALANDPYKDGPLLTGADVTGNYDSKTSDAVKAFKLRYNLGSSQYPDVGPGTTAKLDELCSTKPAPKPEPKPQPVPPGPQPNPQPFNPELEDMMNAVWDVLQYILMDRRDAVDQLTTELRTEVASDQKSWLVDATEDVLKDAFGDPIKKVLDIWGDNNHIGHEVFCVALGAVSGGWAMFVHSAWEAAKNLAPKITGDPSAKDKYSAIDLFKQEQYKLIEETTYKTHQEFLTGEAQGANIDPNKPYHTKKELRKAEALSQGMGLALAKDDRDHLNEARLTATKDQYNESLSGWTVSIAQGHGKGQGKLGTKGEVDEEGHYKDLGTNLTSWKSDTPGVLEIPVGENYYHWSGRPKQQVPHLLPTGKDDKLPGLSDDLRANLINSHKNIKDLSIPVIATGQITWHEVAEDGQEDVETFNLTIGINEKPTPFNISKNSGGKHGGLSRYLRLRATNGADSERGDPSLENEGILKTMQEDIGNIAPGSLKF